LFTNYNDVWEYDDKTDKYENLIEYLQDKISSYNHEKTNKRNKLDYILFDEALRYVCYVLRILFFEKG